MRLPTSSTLHPPKVQSGSRAHALVLAPLPPPPPPPPAAAEPAQRSTSCICLLGLAEFDPDADVFGAGPALEVSDDELAGEPTRCARVLYEHRWGGSPPHSLPQNTLPACLPVLPPVCCCCRQKGREAKRLRGDLVIEGEGSQAYAGRRSSRAAVFGLGDGTEEEEDEGKEEGSEGEASDGDDFAEQASGSSEGDEDKDESDGDSGDDDDLPEEAAAGSGRARGRAAAADDGSDDSGGSDADDGLDAGADKAAGTAAGAADEDEMAALEREYEALQQVGGQADGWAGRRSGFQ